MAQAEKNSPDIKPDGKKTNKALVIGIVVAVVVIAALGFIIYQLLNKPEAEPEMSSAKGTLVTEDNYQDVLDQMNEPVVAGSYVVNMSVDWMFEDGKSPSYTAVVTNDELNEYTVYFDVFLSSSSERIYSSPYIPVGSELSSITLDRALKKGVYPGYVTYYLVDDDMEVLSSLSVNVNITIDK